MYADVCVVFQGRITVTGLLDREKGDMYTLTVVADDGGPKKDSTVVRFILNCVYLSSRVQHPVYYSVCRSCSVLENLKAFLFCSLHLSLGVQKVRHAILFKGNMKSIHLKYLNFFFLKFRLFDSSQR